MAAHINKMAASLKGRRVISDSLQSQHADTVCSTSQRLKYDFVEELAPVVQSVDNAIVDSVVCFVNAYRLDSDLSGG